MASAFDDCALYHQTKIPIGFWYKRGLNPKSLIQPSETLPVALIRYTLIIYRGICQTPLYFLNDLYLHSRFHLTLFFFKNVLEIILFVHGIEMELQHYKHELPLDINKAKGIGLLCSMVGGGGICTPNVSVGNTKKCLCCGCLEPILGPRSRCVECKGCYHHKSCAELPSNCNIPNAQKHPLILFEKLHFKRTKDIANAKYEKKFVLDALIVVLITTLTFRINVLLYHSPWKLKFTTTH